MKEKKILYLFVGVADTYDAYPAMRLNAYRRYEIGDSVPTHDGVYMGLSSIFAIRDGILIANFDGFRNWFGVNTYES